MNRTRFTEPNGPPAAERPDTAPYANSTDDLSRCETSPVELAGSNPISAVVTPPRPNRLNEFQYDRHNTGRSPSDGACGTGANTVLFLPGDQAASPKLIPATAPG